MRKNSKSAKRSRPANKASKRNLGGLIVSGFAEGLEHARGRTKLRTTERGTSYSFLRSYWAPSRAPRLGQVRQQPWSAYGCWRGSASALGSRSGADLMPTLFAA
jgi:hypothetical protein